MEPKERIIIALDTADFGRAFELIDKLSPHVGCFKIGLEFMMSVFAEFVGCDDAAAKQKLEIVRYIFTELHGRIFLDGKFYDIPQTVSGASAAVSRAGVKFFNVHASSGIEAIRAAAKNKGGAKLLVVTALTSLQFPDLWNIGFGRCRNPDCNKYAGLEWGEKFIEDLVLTMAKNAKGYGADGVICSPQELEALNKLEIMRGFLKVVPGVRPSWAAANDQKRVMTPGEAIAAGADYLVIGRPITAPPAEIGSPVEAAKRIAEEIAEAEREVLIQKEIVKPIESIAKKLGLEIGAVLGGKKK